MLCVFEELLFEDVLPEVFEVPDEVLPEEVFPVVLPDDVLPIVVLPVFVPVPDELLVLSDVPEPVFVPVVPELPVLPVFPLLPVSLVFPVFPVLPEVPGFKWSAIDESKALS